MSITITCDYCGEEIQRLGQQTVTITAVGDKGGAKRDRWKDGYVGHYHGEPCYREVMHGILALHQGHDELERIPTATDEQIAEWKPGDEGEHELDFAPLFDIRLIEMAALDPQETPTLRGEWKQRGLYFPNDYGVLARGIRTLGDLRRAIDDGRLMGVKMIGPKRHDEIKSALARIYGTGKVAA
jgi:hypothetical protein